MHHPQTAQVSDVAKGGLPDTAGIGIGDVIMTLQGQEQPKNLTLKQFVQKYSALKPPIEVAFRKAPN